MVVKTSALYSTSMFHIVHGGVNKSHETEATLHEHGTETT